jgi:predicted MFS family arabinose efflux permease
MYPHPGVAIITDTIPEGNRRTLGLALYITAWPIGVGLATVSAGYIADSEWRNYFYLHAAMCAVTVGLVWVGLPGRRGEMGPGSASGSTARSGKLGSFGRIDWVGNVLVTVSIFLLLYVLSMAPGAERGWGTPCESSPGCRIFSSGFANF